MQSEEDWDDGEDWDDDYDDSDSSSILDMELATKMKLAGAVGIALLIILSSTIFTNFGFYSGAGSISVLIDVNEGKDASDNTFTFNILATSPAFGSLEKEGKYTIVNVPNSVEYSGSPISAHSGTFSLNDDGRGSVSIAYSDLFKMNGNYNLQVELGSQKASDSVILNKFSESAVADLVQFDGSKPLDRDDGVITNMHFSSEIIDDPDSNLDFFVNYLKDDDPEIRELSIRCLSHCQEANLYNLLEETIKDEENRVSLAAMNALMDAPLDDAPTGELVSYLENALVNTDTVVRKTAFDLLGHAGSADDFEPALAMLGEALSGSDTIRREAVAEALGSIAPDNGVANVASRQGYVSKWMVLGTFLNDKEHKAFAEELEPEKSIDFEKTYPSKYVWALQGNQRRDGEKAIERDIGWSEASVNKTNGMLLMGPLLPPPGTFSIAYAVSDFTCSEDQELFLTLDGDDAFKVWLNGEKIAEAIAPYLHRQSCVATLENIKIKLKKGKNRILIKSANIENEWWVRARITDANNRPIELF